jgi:hypothetical protein
MWFSRVLSKRLSVALPVALDSVRPDRELSSLPRRMPRAAQPVHWSLKSNSPRTVPNRSRLSEYVQGWA